MNTYIIRFVRVAPNGFPHEFVREITAASAEAAVEILKSTSKRRIIEIKSIEKLGE